MKVKSLISHSSLLYHHPSKWLNSRERNINHDELLYSNNLYPKYSEFHDPLLEELKEILNPLTTRKFRIVERTRYFLGKVARKFSVPKVLRDDLPPSPPATKPIRLRDLDRVIGVFYENSRKIH